MTEDQDRVSDRVAEAIASTNAKDEFLRDIKSHKAADFKLRFLYFSPVDVLSLTTDEWIYICNSIKDNKTIKSLYIEFLLRENWCHLLTDALKVNNSIIELKMESVKPNSCKHLAELLTVNTTIQILDLNGSSIECKGLKFLCEAIDSKNRTLTRLNLAGNQIENDGCIRLCESMKKNSAITFLDLSYNDLEFDSWKSIGEMLAINSTLTELRLCESGYRSEDGCVPFVEGLKKNSSVTRVDVLCNYFNRICAKSLTELIKTNYVLTDISMASDAFEVDEISRNLRDVLKSNTTLTRLSLTKSDIAKNVCKALGEALTYNRTLLYLDLEHNSIDNASLKDLCRGLQENDTLTYLNLAVNKFDTCQPLITVLSENESLTWINIMHNRYIAESALDKFLRKNIKRQHEMNLNIIIAIWNITRRSESLDLFPVEIWSNIFKFVKVPAYPRHYYNVILEDLFYAHRSLQAINLPASEIFAIVNNEIKTLTKKSQP